MSRTILTSLQLALRLDADGGRRLRWLAESAFMALELQQHERARWIFAGLRLLAPNEPVGWLGSAEIALQTAGGDLAVLAEARDDIDTALRKPNCELEKMLWAWRLRAHVCSALGDAPGRDAAEAAVLRLQPHGQLARAIGHQRAMRNGTPEGSNP